VGILADRIHRSKRLVLASRERAEVIEGHICRRLRIAPDDKRLDELSLDFATIAGGRRVVEIVKIGKPGLGEPFTMYGIKRPHGSEPESADLASRLEIGPFVLDVDAKGVIVEEFFPAETNIRKRRPVADEFGPYARSVSFIFRKLIMAGANLLVFHRDERRDHLFILGRGDDIRIKMVDWGWAAIWPMERFQEWGVEQFRWMYLQLSFGEQEIWTRFVRELADGFPEEMGVAKLADAYVEFAKSQTMSSTRSPHSPFALKFLRFTVDCGPLDLDVGPVNEFAGRGAGLTDDELAELWPDIVG